MTEPQTFDTASFLSVWLASAPSVPGVPVTGGPAAADGATGAAGSTAAPGSLGPAGTGTPPPGPSGLSFMLPLLAVMVLMIVMSSFAGRKERKRVQAMIDGLRRYDEVQTTSGIIGKIVEVKTSSVVVKVDESTNTKIEFTKSAIARVIKPSDAPAEAAAS